MFGGLEIKGGGATGGTKNKKEEQPAAAVVESSIGSAFSFLSTATPVPAAAAPASGFSFLNSGTSPQANESKAQNGVAAATGPSTNSSFSFMQASTDENRAAAVSDSASPSASGGLSAFSFLVEPAEPGTAPAPTDSGADTTSAFSFLSQPAQEMTSSDHALPTTGPAASSVSSFSLATVTDGNVDSTSAPLGAGSFSNAPVGSGIVFGGAQVGVTGPKKRRNRAQKIGVAAASAGQTSLPPPSAMATTTSETNKEDTREAAAEAVRRAETFMNNQIRQQAKAEMATATAVVEPPPIASIKSNASEDEVVTAAKAAAEEAMAMSRQGSQGSNIGSRFGAFFGRQSNTPDTVQSRPPASVQSEPRSSPPTTSTPTEDKASVQQETVIVQPKPVKAQSETESAMGMPSSMANSTRPKIQNQTAQPASKLTFTSSLPPSSASSNPKFAVTPFTPSVSMKNTPRGVFDEIIKDFQNQVQQSMTRVSQLRRQRTMLIEERFVSLAKERLATQQVAHAEAQQTSAIEKEDFELADQMQNIIDSHTREKAEVAGMIESITKTLEEIDSQKSQVVNQVIHCFQQVKEKLKKFHEEQESKGSGDETKALKKFSAISKQLSAEHERLQQDLKHLERDEQLVADERKEVENAISEQSGEYERQRDEASQSLVAVESEIEELRRLLAIKQEEAAKLRNDVALHEDEILRVRVKFSRQIQRVQKKESTLQDNRNEYEAETRNWQIQKDAHDSTVKAHSEALLAHEELMTSLQKEVELANVLESIVTEEVDFDQAPSEEKQSDDDDLADLQAEVVKCEAAVSEAKEILNAANGILKNLEMEHQTLVSRIPDLEATKKAAAARRDFKTAGKASKEIKDASARLVECQEELTGDAVERKNAAEKELLKLEQILEEKQKITNEKERESGIAKMKRLAGRIKHLVETKNSVCGETSSETSIKDVGAFVLDEQIKILRIEGQSLGGKYGGWEELDEKVIEEGESKSEDSAEPSQNAVAKSAPGTEGENEESNAKKLPAPLTSESKEERLSQFRLLTSKVKDIEDMLEIAVEQEDYDKAAELDEALQKLLASVEALGLTDEEMEAALLESLDDAGGHVAHSSSDATVEKQPDGEEGQMEAGNKEVKETSVADVQSSDETALEKSNEQQEHDADNLQENIAEDEVDSDRENAAEDDNETAVEEQQGNIDAEGKIEDRETASSDEGIVAPIEEKKENTSYVAEMDEPVDDKDQIDEAKLATDQNGDSIENEAQAC